MKIIDISKGGIRIKSKVCIEVGDFINLTISIEGRPSFWCFAEVKWVKKEEESWTAGCEFYLLRDEYKELIDTYIKEYRIEK